MIRPALKGHEVNEFAGYPSQDQSDAPEASAQTLSVKDVVNSLSVHEAHDLLVAMKAYIDEDRGVRAKQLFKEFPQLTTAYSEIQMKLGMGLGITQADLQSNSRQPCRAVYYMKKLHHAANALYLLFSSIVL